MTSDSCCVSETPKCNGTNGKSATTTESNGDNKAKNGTSHDHDSDAFKSKSDETFKSEKSYKNSSQSNNCNIKY